MSSAAGGEGAFSPAWDGRESNSVAIFSLTMTGIAWLVVGFRLYARLKLTAFGVDDWAVIPATVLVTVNGFLACYADLRAGIGRPLWAVTYGEYIIWLKCTLASSFLYPVMISTVHISVLLFYRRLIGPSYQALQRCITVLLLSRIPYVAIYELLLVFMCRPPSAFWKPYERNKACRGTYYYRLHIALYSASLAFDLLVLGLPLKVIWELKMQRRQRIMVCVLVTLGASACLGVAYRVALCLSEMRHASHIDPRWSSNPLSSVIPPQLAWQGLTYWVPSIIESNVAIIGASLPAISRLLSRQRRQRLPRHDHQPPCELRKSSQDSNADVAGDGSSDGSCPQGRDFGDMSLPRPYACAGRNTRNTDSMELLTIVPAGGLRGGEEMRGDNESVECGVGYTLIPIPVPLGGGLVV